MGSSTYMGGRHLTFYKQPLEKDAKMHKYKVVNHVRGEEIGIIHWRGGWRQYVFQALPKVDMSRSCHKEVDKFIDGLMLKWENELKQRKIKEHKDV
jgi:hypothetical protein